MGNAIWFILLAALSILLLTYTLWKKRDVRLLMLFFGLGAIAGLLEFVIFVWLESYEYYPGLMENTYFDNALGAFLSQVVYVSSAALFIAAFNLRFRWLLIFALMFVALEYLFLTLGVFKHNWWHSSFTGGGLFIYFWIAKVWYKLLLQAPSGLMRWVILFCSSYIMYSDLLSISLYTDHYHFVGGYFANAARDTLTVFIVITLIKSFVISLICYYRLNRVIKVLTTIMMWVSYSILMQLNIMSFQHYWDLIYFAATDIIILICCSYFNKVLSRKQMNREKRLINERA